MSAYSDTGRNGSASGGTRIPFVELVAPFHFIADGLIAGINLAVDAAHKASTEAARRRQARRTIDKLQRLDNHMLRDIGINRSEISRIGLEASNSDDEAWQHPGRDGK